MVTLTADSSLQELLAAIKETAEIRDVSGNVLGHFTPVLSPEEEAAYARAVELFDPVETERIAVEQHGQGIPLEEFWRRLEAGEYPG